jgi:hypothetical protein
MVAVQSWTRALPELHAGAETGTESTPLAGGGTGAGMAPPANETSKKGSQSSRLYWTLEAMVTFCATANTLNCWKV